MKITAEIEEYPPTGIKIITYKEIQYLPKSEIDLQVQNKIIQAINKDRAKIKENILKRFPK